MQIHNMYVIVTGRFLPVIKFVIWRFEMFPGPRFAANWTFPGSRSWSCLCLVPGLSPGPCPHQSRCQGCISPCQNDDDDNIGWPQPRPRTLLVWWASRENYGETICQLSDVKVLYSPLSVRQLHYTRRNSRSDFDDHWPGSTCALCTCVMYTCTVPGVQDVGQHSPELCQPGVACVSPASGQLVLSLPDPYSGITAHIPGWPYYPWHSDILIHEQMSSKSQSKLISDHVKIK